MEVSHSDDEFTVRPDGKPSRVTDYKLFFPQDFKSIQEPRLDFVTDENYIQPSFRINSSQTISTITDLRRRKAEVLAIEHGILHVREGDNFYQARTILTGEGGIGYQVNPNIQVSDFFHTHSVYEGEKQSIDLFSAFDLMAMGSKGAERYWLVGKDVVWVLVNHYGQSYYSYIKDACMDMAKKYKSSQSYDEMLTDLIECSGKCEYRLYKSEDTKNYTLVNK